MRARVPSFLREMVGLEGRRGMRTAWTHRRRAHGGCGRRHRRAPDVFLKLGGKDYRLWSYLDSERGLDNVKSKLSGARGEIPAGVHVLCPINITRARDEVSGWRFYPEAKIAEIVDVIERGEPRYDYQTVRGSLDRCVRKACLIEKA